MLFTPRALPRIISTPLRSPTFLPTFHRTMSSTTTSIAQKLDALRNYSACDVRLSIYYSAHRSPNSSVNHPTKVSDALLKIQKVPEGTTPRAGHLADFSMSH